MGLPSLGPLEISQRGRQKGQPGAGLQQTKADNFLENKWKRGKEPQPDVMAHAWSSRTQGAKTRELKCKAVFRGGVSVRPEQTT